MDDDWGYIEGKGYVARKRKPTVQSARGNVAPSGSNDTVKPHAEVYGSPVQAILTKVFGTVPRNRLKEAGLE